MNKPDLRGGLSSADLRSRSGVTTVRRVPGTGTEDDFDKALAIERKMAANRIIRRTVAETEAEEIKAQGDALEQKVRLQNIQEQLKGGSGNEFLGQLMEEIKDLKRQIAEQREAMTNQQLEDLKGSLTAITDEINNLRGGQGTMLETVKQQVQQARDLVELFTPEREIVSTGTEDRALAAYMLRNKLEEKKLDQEGQKLQWEREDRLALAREELEVKRQAAQEELRLKEQHYEQQDRFITETLPQKVLPLLEKIATAFRNKSSGQPSPSIAPATSLPEGVEAATCQQCGATIYYRQGMTRVICPNPQCLAEYELKDEADEPAASE